MAQVVFSFSNSDIIKCTAGISMGAITGKFYIGGVCYQGASKGVGCRVTCARTGKTIFNGVATLTNSHIDHFMGRPYIADGINVVMSSGEAEIYLV